MTSSSKPSSASVRWLHAVRAADAASVGGKAANLGELLGKGFPVPPGFVVPGEAYARHLVEAGIAGQVRLLGRVATGDSAERCSEVHDLVQRSELASDLALEIRSAHAQLLAERGPGVLCAVRSSATAEDLASASFAGQHGTYYHVEAAQLLDRVRQCWASLWSPAAVSYRATHGIDHGSVAMAVVVQELIASEVSGVAFTAHPVSGSREELVVESSWGMGAAIVDGRVTPDRFVVERDGLRIRERRIADKRLMVAPRVEAGRADRLEEVPPALRRADTLTVEQVRLVADWALRCEAHFGKPQDVEWAFRAGRFSLLQSRPITRLGREEVGKGVSGKWVLFKPLVENFTDPLTPLSADMLMVVRPPGLKAIRGWLYMDVELLQRLLPFEVSAEDLAGLLYSLSKDGPAWKLSPRKLPLAVLAGVTAYLVLAVVLARARRLPDAALQGFRALCRELDADPAVGPEAALHRLWLLPRLLDPVARMPLFVNLAAAPFMPWMGVLRWLVRRFAPDLRPDADVLLGSGSEGVLSAEMGRGIRALAEQARRSARVRAILAERPAAAALAELRREPQASAFLERLELFLAVHGHRAIKEFELRAPRWEEDPAAVLGMVRNYLLIEAPPEVDERKGAAARDQLLLELRGKLRALPLEKALGPRLGLVRFVAGRVRYFLKLRENSRFYHIMVPGVVRRKVLRIEAELMREGKLKCRDDIFFLSFAELSDLQAGRLGWLDVEDRVRERRIEHVRLCKVGPPRTLGFDLPRRQPAAGLEAAGLLLQGQAASPGRYEGEARVILDPSIDAELKPGEVLVAPYTDPAWTPLFLTAGAAVVEVGSYLSHAGTVAREFGMPCVVDVAEATHQIRTGDRLAVDGHEGSVRILDAGPRA